MKILLDGRAFDFEGHPTILDVARANGVEALRREASDQPALHQSRHALRPLRVGKVGEVAPLAADEEAVRVDDG